MLRVSMISLTYANKSKIVLENSGYKTNIVHNVTPKGCEYILTVNAPKSIVVTILQREGIPIKEFL